MEGKNDRVTAQFRGGGRDRSPYRACCGPIPAQTVRLKRVLTKSATDPGPENTRLKALNIDNFMPPPSDHGSVPTFWSSFFGGAPPGRRGRMVPSGGSNGLSDFDRHHSQSVNMRLIAGGVRELHWHAADEWALMLDGNCRLHDRLRWLHLCPTTSRQATCGTSRPVFRILCKAWGRTAANSLLVFDDGEFLRRQYYAAVRLDDPYPARGAGQELGRGGKRARSAQKYSAGGALHLSDKGAGAA